MIDRVPVSDDDRPDIAVEVVWTSGGIDKLEVYRKLGVREVWYYGRGTLRFFTLRCASYAEIERSELLPGADPALFVRCMAEPNQTDAIKMLCEALRRPGLIARVRRSARAQLEIAVSSISTLAPRGSAATCTVARAGGSKPSK